MLALAFVITYVPKLPSGPYGRTHLGDAAIYAPSFLFRQAVGHFADACGTTFPGLPAGHGSCTSCAFSSVMIYKGWSPPSVRGGAAWGE